jgi:thioredoxin reductase (NADPH)
VEYSHGRSVRARSVIIATGAEYRRLDIADADRYLGVGIYFAATPTEAKRCKDEEVIVVGGTDDGERWGKAALERLPRRSARVVSLAF